MRHSWTSIQLVPCNLVSSNYTRRRRFSMRACNFKVACFKRKVSACTVSVYNKGEWFLVGAYPGAYTRFTLKCSDIGHRCDSFMTPHIFNVKAQTRLPVPNVKFTNVGLATKSIDAKCLCYEWILQDYFVAIFWP